MVSFPNPIRTSFARSNRALLLSVAAIKLSSESGYSRRKLTKNLRYPRRGKVPTDPKAGKPGKFPKLHDGGSNDSNGDGDDVDVDSSVWTEYEISVISTLFERGGGASSTKSKPTRKNNTPSTTRSGGIPMSKHHIRSGARPSMISQSRSPISSRIRKNPDFLIGLAKEIGCLPTNADVSEVLDKWAKFLRKGSLSMTVRELGHMCLPERAIQTLCWVQTHSPALFPDDRILASTVEVLARNGQLRLDRRIEEYLNSASRTVVEAMARGFIKARNVNMARRILLFAKDNNRTLNSSIYAKLILEAVKNPDRHRLVEVLLDELGGRQDLDELEPQDCTGIMKVCAKLGKFEAMESVFRWYRESGRSPTVVMYTTVIHGRYSGKSYREGLAAVWEMEESGVVLDLPAYRVVIRLCAVGLGDLRRAARYFSRLKADGFCPTYDIYRDMILAYGSEGRFGKCKQICKELNMAGFNLDNATQAFLQHAGNKKQEQDMSEI